MSEVWKIQVWPCCRYQACGSHADDCPDELYEYRRVPGCESWREPVPVLVCDVSEVEEATDRAGRLCHEVVTRVAQDRDGLAAALRMVESWTTPGGDLATLVASNAEAARIVSQLHSWASGALAILPPLSG